MSTFKLSKWYLDCVTESGDTSIAYAGTVHWGAIHFHYSSLLESAAERVTVTHSLRDQGEPQITGTSIRWRPPTLGIDGEWRSDSPSLRKTIFSSEDGAIEWHCLMPQAQVRMRERAGLGYVENLTMTIAPWRLPIRTLRWGRFTTASESVVWIDWRGEFTTRMVYANGIRCRASVLEDNQILFEDGARLIMDRGFVLRDGALGATALSAIPGVRETFPARLLRVKECKWRSRARLERPGKPSIVAWAIHERVSWPE